MKKRYISTVFEAPSAELYNTILDEKAPDEDGNVFKILIGKRIRLGSSQHKGFLQNNKKLKSVTFICETFVLDDTLYLPGVNIKIYASHLKLESGHIDISGEKLGKPDDKSIKDIKEQKKGSQGKWYEAVRRGEVKNGNSSGGFEIYASNILTKDNNHHFFIANGGDAQKPLAGENGKNGGDYGRQDDPYGIAEYICENYNDIEKKRKTKLTSGSQLVYLKLISKEAMLNDTRTFNKIEAAICQPGVTKVEVYMESSYSSMQSNQTFILDAKIATPTNAIGASPATIGGNSGALITNHPNLLPKLLSVPGKGFDSPAYVGGKTHFDYPKKVYYKVEDYTTKKADFKNLKVTTNGPVVIPGEPYNGEAGKVGEPGKNKTDVPDIAWLHPALVKLLLDVKRDEFFCGALDGPDEVITNLYNSIMSIKKTELESDYFQALWEDNQFIAFDAARAEIISLYTKLSQGFDFYGNSRGYMPVISLDEAQAFYKKSVSRLPLAFVSSAIVKKTTERSHRIDAVQKTLSDLNQRITGSKAKLEAAMVTCEELEEELYGSRTKLDIPLSSRDIEGWTYDNMFSKIKDVKVINEQIKVILLLIQRREKELKKKAEETAEDQQLAINMCKFAGIACRLIPYGQPALGTVGGAVFDGTSAYLEYSRGDDLDWEGLGNKFKPLKELYEYNSQKKDIAKLTAKEISSYDDRRASIVTAYSKVLASEDEKKQKAHQKELDEAKKKLKKTRDNLSPDYKTELSSALDVYNGWAVSDTIVNAEYKKIKKSDSDLERITKLLEFVNRQKSLCVQRLNKCLDNIDEIRIDVLSAHDQMLRLADLNMTLSSQNKPALLHILNAEKRYAYKDLYYYFYLLTKAYEAYYLEPSTIKFRSEAFTSALQVNIADIDKNPNTSIIDTILKSQSLIELFFDVEIQSPDKIRKSVNVKKHNSGWTINTKDIRDINSLINNREGSEVQSLTFSERLVETRDFKTISKNMENCRLAGISLKEGGEIRFHNEVKGSDGKFYQFQEILDKSKVFHDEFGEFIYSLKGKHFLKIVSGESIGGRVKTNHKGSTENFVYLSLKEPYIFEWEYDFRKNTVIGDDTPTIIDATIGEGGENKKIVINGRSKYALPPLDTEYSVSYTAEPVLLTKIYVKGRGQDKQLPIQLFPKLIALDFNVTYKSRSTS